MHSICAQDGIVAYFGGNKQHEFGVAPWKIYKRVKPILGVAQSANTETMASPE
jgi:hypothetical protein